MRRALSLKAQAEKLLFQYNEWVLVQMDSASHKEIINAGDPVQYKKDSYHRVEIPISGEARRYIFRLWKREIGLKYNACVRELNQIGMAHGLQLITLERPHP